MTRLQSRVVHAGGARVWQPQNCTIRGRSPRRCGRGYSWKSALDAGWHGFPESSAVKGSRASACVSPASPGAPARRTVGGAGGGSDPFFGRWCATGQGTWCARMVTPSPLPVGGRSLHSEPCGKAAEPARKRIWKWKIRGRFSGRHGPSWNSLPWRKRRRCCALQRWPIESKKF